MTSELGQELESILEALGSAALSSSISWIAGVVGFVLGAIALYALAQRRGIRHAWLAWIPVGNQWILGSLADQYQYVAHREVKNKRKALLTLSIIQAVIVAIMILTVIGFFVSAVAGVYDYTSEDTIFMAIGGVMLGLAVLSLPIAGIAIARIVIRFMALYNVYQSMEPENATMFLVLSIFFRITEPFFLFFNRQKDKGMVRDQPAAAYQAPSYVNAPANEAEPAPAQSPENYQNPQGTAEPWTEKKKDQDPWDQGPEQL